MNIMCLTPIDHVDGAKEKLASFGHLIHSPLESDKSIIHGNIVTHHVEALYVNPNKQKYIIDQSILEGTTVKTIVTVSRGTNHIDIEYCEKAGINVIHLNKDPIASKNSSTAEHALGLTLALIRFLPQSFDSVKHGHWDFYPFIGHQLQSMKVGVIGMGNLGTKYASYCRAIGADVIECTKQKHGSFEHVLWEADVISLHAPLNGQTYHMISSDAIGRMKSSGVFIINTSRGAIVDEDAIVEGLENRRIKGYATDVLEEEAANISENKLVKAAQAGMNVIITPHVAGSCFESQRIAHFRAIELFERHIQCQN